MIASEDYQGFLSDKPLIRSRQIRTLSTYIWYNESRTTRKFMIESYVKKGYGIGTEECFDYKAFKKAKNEIERLYKIAPVFNATHPLTIELREKDSSLNRINFMKKYRFLRNSLYRLSEHFTTKTGMDYAEHLIKIQSIAKNLLTNF